MSERSDMPSVLPAPLREKEPNRRGPESRAQVRYPFTAAAEVYELRSQIRLTGRCSDLSAGGCYIDTISPFAAGSIVRIQMRHDSREFEATAAVAYTHVQMGMGLAFTEIRREHQETLRSWIANLSGEQPPEPAVSAPEPGTRTMETSEVSPNMRFVMNELITLLVRKKIITETEASGLLREMFR